MRPPQHAELDAREPRLGLHQPRVEITSRRARKARMRSSLDVKFRHKVILALGCR